MSGKHLSIDPQLEAEGGGWPRPEAHPYPVALGARTSPAKSFVAPIASVLALGTGLVALLASRPEAPTPLVGLFAVFIVAASLCAGGFLRARRLSGRNEPLVELNVRGLSCPTLFGKIVPWSEIYEVRRVGTFERTLSAGPPGIRIWVRDINRFEPRWPSTILGKSGPLPATAFVPLPSLLDVSQRHLYQSIQAHRAHLGRGGHPLAHAAEQAAAA